MDRSSASERNLIGSSMPGAPPGAFVVTGLLAVGFAVAIFYAATVTLSILGALVLLWTLLFTMRTFVLWQKLSFVALAGFVVLSYGFTNWTLLPGKPIPVGHLLLFTAVVIALQRHRREAAPFLNEPAVLWWLLLVGLSMSHLVFDIPRYGTYAVRDASFVFEGLFMLLGFLSARGLTETNSFLKALAVMFLLNTAYSLTFPIADTLGAISPVSGIFQQVPLLGSYPDTPLFLVAGGLYYLLVMRHVREWPQGLILILAALQTSWSFVFQQRSVYIGTAIALVLLFLFGGVRRGGKLVAILGGSVVVFFAVIALTGSVIQGRVGEVGPAFLGQHVQSLFLDPNAPAEDTVQWRLDLMSQLRERWAVDSRVMTVGEGFGQPLIDFENSENVAVRQPHNTHITVLIRLGALGFLVWLLMHWRILTSLFRFLRNSERGTLNRDLALWLFLFYVLGIVFTTFQPWLEFSYGAIPFYFFVGIALAMAHARREDQLRGPHGNTISR
jgi:hypothetical protein